MTQTHFDLTQASARSTQVNPDMDPRLQFYVARRRAGVVRAESVSTAVDEIGVVARVKKTSSWESLSEVREPVVIGKTKDNDFIVTGRVPITRIENVRTQSFVKSLKAAQEMQPDLHATTQETAARPTQLPAGHKANGGDGTVVGVIDYGGDFAHENFRNGDGTTRLLSLWFQDGPTTAGSPFGYGRELSAAELNLALNQANPYQAVGYDPANYDSGSGSHGTHVMDIAGGNGRGSGVPGMAPNSDLIFVNISHALDPTGTAVVGKSFADSVRLLEAAKYIFDKAGTQPCVINISLGTNAAPHDGSTLVEQGFDALLRAAPNRVLTISASNSFDDGIHAAGTVSQGSTVDLEWELSNLARNIEMEIWFSGSDRITVELISPNGVTLLSASPGTNQSLTTPAGQVAVFMANRLNDPNNGDNMIGIFLSAGMPGGSYTVRLHGDTVSAGDFHAWIERDNSFQSQFAQPHDNSHTIGSVSCSNLSIAVGSYDGHKAATPLSFFSSAGPTRDGRQKPEVSAPGHAVRAARSSTKIGTTLKSGTSMAAPAVAGLVALMLSEARSRGIDLDVNQVRDILIKTARRKPPAGTAWHPRYGHGRVSASEAVAEVIALATPPPTPAAAATAKKASKKKPSKKKKRAAKKKGRGKKAKP